ncbi:MAG: phosphoenolpyruvate--protein phosphotransferase [Hyphomicrobiaceae bacterium]
MPKRPIDEPPIPAVEPALRIIMRRLREIMGEPTDGQSRLDRIVRQIANLMVAEVCSIYLKRQDGSLELIATEGLNKTAVHNTFMKRGEGLVGRCAELALPVNEPDAQTHPAFSYRPETGEEIYHSFLAVPILRGGEVLGVLTVQNKTPREYPDDDVEALQATAMVLAEHLVTGAVTGMTSSSSSPAAGGMVLDAIDRTRMLLVRGTPIAEGLALGHVVLHEPRIVVTELTAKDPEAEAVRLEAGITELKATLDELIDQGDLAREGEHRDVLEAYRMFANDRGWQRRLSEAVASGLTAEAAVERVQNQTRARMLRQTDPFWRERMRDLDDLSDRLSRVLAAQRDGGSIKKELPEDTVLVARTMGTSELLDYDRARLRGLVIEDGSGQSHVAIVARALGIAAVGQAKGLMDRVQRGNPIVIDAESGEIYVRPTGEVIAAYQGKARFRASRQRKYNTLVGQPAVTRDGQKIELLINAGLQVEMSHLAQSGAEGVGLFRTELQFMVAPSFPRLDRQTQVYRNVLAGAAGKPVVFRTLDIGGDKVLSYMNPIEEENPALGWRGIRMTLDRPAMLKTQLRALIRAANGGELHIMVPMVSEASEFAAVKAIIDRELELAVRRGSPVPAKLHLGIMIEVPSLLFELDRVLPMVDFVSIGSNDLMQYMFAADRGNPRVGARYSTLSASFLRALKSIALAGERHKVPVTLCGEIGGRPLEAMALIALGIRSLSMTPASIGPVKAMVLSLDAERARLHLDKLLDAGSGNLRDELGRFAENEGVEI